MSNDSIIVMNSEQRGMREQRGLKEVSRRVH